MIEGDNMVTARANPFEHPTDASTPPSGESRAILAALGRLGHNVDSLLAKVGLRRADIANPDAPIPSHVCAGILAAASQEVKNLPLRLALELPLGSHPLLDYIMASAESVGASLRRLARYLRLVNPAVRIELRDQQDVFQVIVDDSSASRFAVELTVSLSVLRLRGETGNALQAKFVSFRHEPDDPDEFGRVLGCPIHTRSSWDGWALSREAWQLPLRHSDPVLGNWLERHATQLLASQPVTREVASEVRRFLTTRLAEGDMAIQGVARHLAMTPRTLQRRLAEEGTSYDVCRETVRRQAAETFLADQSLSVGEIAYLLGYSEPAAFHRAFRRWYGTAPRAFRQQRLQPGNLI